MRPTTSLSLLAIAALALLPAKAYAQDTDAIAEKIACMDTGYSEAEQAARDDYIANFSLNDYTMAEKLGVALGRRTEQCAGEGAGENTLMMLAQHQFALLSERGIAATRPDIVEVINRIDTKLAPEKRTRFMAIFNLMVFGDPETGEQANLSGEDEEWFSNVVVTEPVNGTIEQSELIGAFLAARALRAESIKQLEASGT